MRSPHPLLLSFLVTIPLSAAAQLPTADLSRIEPRAARAGETVEVNLFGTNLETLSELRFTSPGITARQVTLPPDDIYPEPRADGNRFQITVAADVPPGIYEARAVGFYGLSTARAFVVAAPDSSELVETANNSTQDQAMPIELNSIVSGTVASRGIDWYRIDARADSRVLIEVLAERIDSRLDGMLILYDADQREIARNRDWFGRDPFLELSPPADGTYFLAVSDILYRGGAEHFYRLSVSDRPHIDFIDPPMGSPGSTQTYTIYGRNLPGGSFAEGVQREGKPLEAMTTEITLPDRAATPESFHPGRPREALLPGFDFHLEGSNAVRIGFATAPVVLEQPELREQSIDVPAEIAGRFSEPNDQDTYRFTAAAATSYCIETIADRMGSMVDPMLIVQRVAIVDDRETLVDVATADDLKSFFSADLEDTINADSTDAAVCFTAEEAGEYVVTVVNQFGTGGAAQQYRLAIRKPVHDFQLMATTEKPLATNRAGYSVTPHLRRGSRWAIRIIAPRQDDFAGDIVITAEGLPTGVRAQPLTLSGTTDEGFLIVSADADAAAWAGEIQILGTAQIGDQQVVRSARFAALVWGHVFADSIRVRSRLTTRIPLSVNGYEEAPVGLAPAEQKDWTVEVGQKLEIPLVVLDNGSRTGNLTVKPKGLYGLLRNPPTVDIADTASEATLVIDFVPNGNFDVKPGRYQFALQGTGVTKYRHNVPALQRAQADQQRIENLIAGLKAESQKQDEAVARQLKQAENAKSQIDQQVSAAEKQAAEKNEKFAAWSDLMTVIVTAPETK